MKLRRSTGVDEVVELPGARLVPDPREITFDVVRFAGVLTPSGDDGRVARVVQEHAVRGGSLCRMLIDEAGIDERTLAFSLARQLQLTLADLRSEAPAAVATPWIQGSEAHRFGLLPYAYDGRSLSVAIIDPFDVEALRYLERRSVLQVNLAIAPAHEIRAAINLAYPALADVSQHVRSFVANEPVAVTEAAGSLLTIADADAPIVQVVDKIVTQALRERASDVHIEPGDEQVRVRYRVDGALKDVLTLPVAMGPALVSRLKILSDLNIIEKRHPQDGQFQMKVDDHDLDVRVSTTGTIWGEKVVLRLLDKRKSLLRLADLGMPAKAHDDFVRMVTSPFGMVVVAGPTGSGKTTTLYATLSEINRPDLNVTTIEDPVEYVFPRINQIQVSDKSGLSFATGLKSILRQDPDVILVGEMRDVETARLAVQSALTGHTVLSSVHAVDSVAALYRLLDMGIESFLITSSIVGVVAQRLVRRTCTSCAAPYSMSPAERATFIRLGGNPDHELTRGIGCNLCSGTGFYERVGIYEVLTVNDDIRSLVVEGRSPRDARAVAEAKGLRTLQTEAVKLVEQGVTTLDEVVRHVFVAEDLA